ncbi:DUF6232 family protein [Streptomyces sp. NBC_00335]|uniref:DUF6232 family protein n=1 Tax=unclassified Streptomyces TaxID=2593676 RepID=UPI0022503A6E|nr:MULTISPECIES: DUF6232 family protein [unclassified Streptomyces]MCX5405364.1 DUF6232 family protein [Streptomyces sp. NBC_00086]
MTVPPQEPPQETPQPPVAPPVVPPALPPVPRSLAHSQGPESQVPGWGEGVDEFGVTLRVSRRLLWVGQAVYPLHNVVRVQSFVLKPNRTKAALQFGLWMVVMLVLASLSKSISGSGVPLIIVLVMILLVAQLVWRLTRPNVFAMAVETSGTPLAVVTLARLDDLRGLVRRIVDAIEHPEKEFSIYVHQLQVKLGDYHFGDTVNINGGNGNKGILK